VDLAFIMSDQPLANDGGDVSSSTSAPAAMATETSISDAIIADVVKEQQYQEINARVIDLEKKLESERKSREEIQAKYEEEREFDQVRFAAQRIYCS
jgi:uncharacterized protein YlxW (UPF0749 family)